MELGAQADDHEDLDLVLTVFGRGGHARGLEYIRIGHDLPLHFKTGDVFPATANGVFLPVCKEIVSFLVTIKQIAGVKPAVSPCMGSLFGATPVPGIQFPWTIRSYDKFADLSGGYRDVVVINQPYLGSRPHFAAASRMRDGTCAQYGGDISVIPNPVVSS